ncbi:hypothetical protein ACE1B6_28205 [Aerosakkonemataceae cyanobacterium BLCC-F154]|uniref:Secreted protein n=1 Tax=Floridaenema fluviatile BLCC-F154 TaxID=3153640 RepID=A0ABV4YJZ7_9CYAN
MNQLLCLQELSASCGWRLWGEVRFILLLCFHLRSLPVLPTPNRVDISQLINAQYVYKKWVRAIGKTQYYISIEQIYHTYECSS